MATAYRRRRLRLRRDLRRLARRRARGAGARGGVGARHRALGGRRYPRLSAARAARRVRVAVAAAAPGRSRRDWLDLLRGEVAAAAIDARIVDREASMEIRSATHRLVTSAGGDAIQRYRFLLPGLAVTAHGERRHADAHAARAPRHLPAGRRRDPAALRLRRQRAAARRGGDRAAARAQLPRRPDGRAAAAGPDGPADPRVDRPSAGTRSDPGRRTQLRRHQFRDAGDVRHLPLRLRAAQRLVRPVARRGARELRVRRRRRPRAQGVPDPQRHPRATARRCDLAAAIRAARRRQHARRQLEPAADRPDGERQPRARRRFARRHRSPASSAAC